MKNPIERFMAKVKVIENGCWLWTGSKGKSGYGHFWFAGQYIDAHKFSYMWHFNGIPIGKLVLHECDNKLCVNPDHLKLGTQHENMIDWHSRHPHSISPLCTFEGKEHSSETKQKLSILAKGNTYCKNRSLSPNIKRDTHGRFIAVAHPEMSAFRKEGDPSVTIRKI